MSEKHNEITSLSYSNWIREQARKGFKPGKVGSEKEISARCLAIEDDQAKYGDWLIQQQKEEEKKQYLLRKERREQKSRREAEKNASIGKGLMAQKLAALKIGQ